MFSRICMAVFSLMLMAGAAGAQPNDPWDGYEVRDIRALRDQAAEKRERLRDLARKDTAMRGVMTRTVLGEDAPAVRVPMPIALPAGRIIRPAASGPEAAVQAVAAAPSRIRPAEMKPPGTPWPGPGLAGDTESRAAFLRDAPLRLREREPGASRAWPGPALEGGESWRATWMRARVVDAWEDIGNRPLQAVVDIRSQEVTLIDGGVVMAVWKASTGKQGHETTVGEWRSTFLSRHHRSSQHDNAPMPCSVFFHNGEAFHGTDALHKLGQPASHGCVRLETKNACRLFDMVAARGAQSLQVSVRP